MTTGTLFGKTDSGGDDAPLTGRMIRDFRVRERIGAGGFGVVYRAEQPLLDREAVIKVVARDYDVSVQRFLREARLASKIDHPFAAHVYDFGIEPDGVLWIAMEYVRGISLDHWLEREGPMAPHQLSPFLDRLADVLHTAHEHGIVHRDVKPSNVMVVPRAGKLLPKLLDLGIAKLVESNQPESAPSEPLDRPAARLAGTGTLTAPAATPSLSRDGKLTRTGSVVGSPPYIAPELWSGMPADRRADVYALGVLCFEALTGARPFEADNLAGFAEAHLHRAIPRSSHRSHDGFFAVALAKSPEVRYATALELSAAFREATGLPGAVRALPRLDRKIRDAFVTDAIQPLAAAVTAVDTAHSAHHARDAVLDLLDLVARLLAVLALAAHSRAQSAVAAPIDSDAADALRELRRHGLSPTRWLELARALVRPFERDRDAHPLPALVGWLVGDEYARFAPLFEQANAAHGDDDRVHNWLVAHIPELDRLLASLELLLEHAVFVPGVDGDRLWNGHTPGVRFDAATPQLASLGGGGVNLLATSEPNIHTGDGRPCLLNAAGQPVLRLWPLVQLAAPTPAAPQELFVVDGPGRQGARLRAYPSRFTIESAAVWDWLASNVLADRDAAGAVSREHDDTPYLGLNAFGTEHARAFFGRERETMECANELQVSPLVCLVGPSGSGKSSFVRAGLLPALADHRHIALRPGPSPVATLAAHVGNPALAPALRRDPELLVAALRELARERRVVVVIDQCEELFTACRDPGERRAFADAISACCRNVAEPIRIILVVRDDFLMRAEALFGVRLPLSPYLYLLGVPRPRDLVRIVVEPARSAGFTFDDPALPEKMVAEVGERAGALPLLAFACAQLWQRRDAHFRRLLRAAYDAMGGVAGALARHADVVLDAMTGADQRVVRETFRHLVTAEGTRAVVTREELRELVGSRCDAVLERLLDARLVTTAKSEGDDRVEIIHEALIGAWPRLAGWQRDDSEGALLRDELRAAARQWEARNRPRDLLWRGERLAELNAWRSRHQAALTASEGAFVDASAADAIRVRRVRRRAIAAVIATLGLAVAVLVWTTDRERDARRRAETLTGELEANIVDQFRNQGRRELLAGDAAKASVYLGEALRRGADDPGLRYMIARALPPLAAELARFTGHTREIESLEVSPDGGALVTASGDGTARVWDMATGRATAVLDRARDKVSIARFDPAGERVAVGSYDHTLTIYRRTGESLVSIAHANYVQSVGFAPAGDRIVTTASEDTVAHVWNAATGAGVLALPHDRPAKSAVFDPRGARIATTSLDSTIRIWDAATGKLLHRLVGHHGPVARIVYSPDGNVLVSGSDDKTARLWDASSGRQLAVLDGYGFNVTSAAFSPDGLHVATAGEDGTGRVWDVPNGELELTLLGHTGAIRTIAFDRAGERIVTASRDGTARIWDARTGAVLASLQGHVEPVKAAVFSPDGARVVTASQDATARLWDASRSRLRAIVPARGLAGAVFTAARSRLVAWTDDGTVALADSGGRPLGILRADDGPIVGVAVAADGRRAVIASRERPPAIWDLDAGRAVITLGRRPAHRVAIGSSGTALTADNASAQLWDITTGRAIAELAHGSTIDAAGFSPRGNRVFTGSRDKTGKLWDAQDGRLIATLAGHQSWVWQFAFAADGTRVVTASLDGTARIWDAGTGRMVHELRGHSGPINAVAFDRTGRRVVTGSQDATATIWDADTGECLGSLGRHGHVIMAVAFSPDGALVATASMDGTARIWDAARFEQIDAMDVTWPSRTSDTNIAWIEFGANSDTVLVASRFGVLVWATDRDTRDRAVVERWIGDHAPYRLSRASLVRVHSD